MLKIFRLAKLARLHWIQRFSKEYPTQARLVQFFMAFFFTVHLMACSYWAVVRDVCPYGSAIESALGSNDPFCASSDSVATSRGVFENSKPSAFQYASAFYWATW